ncbi:MAG: RNA-binding protein [Elusimicrobiales bacterium]|nr:RNA-binding protein [Elusimicrobiales bacterium]
MKKLYVGGLPFKTGDDELNSLFASYGKVTSAKVIKDKFSGRSRGFGFVEMEDDNEALAAITKLNGTEYEGRKLTVNEARPMTEGGNNRRNNRRGWGEKRNFNRW